MDAHRTTFTLDVPAGVDYPMALVVSNITTNPYFRSQVNRAYNTPRDVMVLCILLFCLSFMSTDTSLASMVCTVALLLSCVRSDPPSSQ